MAKRRMGLKCRVQGCLRQREDLRFLKCRACRDAARASKARTRAGRRMVGACVTCCVDLPPETVEAGYDTCTACRDEARARWAKWERQHPEYVRPFYDGEFPRRRD